TQHRGRFGALASVFLTMVSDNILMAQSLFGLLLGQSPYRLRHAVASRDRGLKTGSARLLPQDALLRVACAPRPVALRSCASEVPLTDGRVVFDLDSPPATY